jgi:hypothetical protein
MYGLMMTAYSNQIHAFVFCLVRTHAVLTDIFGGFITIPEPNRDESP